MSEVKSLNPYALLGNTSDQDSDREPEPPTKAVDKPTARHGKRDAPKAGPVAAAASAPAGAAGSRGGADRRRGGFTGSEAAFRDRATGRGSNRDKPTEDGDGALRGRGRGRGARGPRRGGDRRDRTGQQDHQKQTDQAWGEPTGEGEWADEKAGDAIAKEEVKEGGYDANVEAPVDADGNALGADAEPENNNKSYADYLAEKAAQKLESLGLKEARGANEGAKENKKWTAAKALDVKDDQEYFVGAGEKAARQRERKQKEYVDIDFSIKGEQPSEGGRGRGRGRGRGGPREGRGGRGEFGGRGDRGGERDREREPGQGQSGRGDFAGRGDHAGRGRGRGRGGVGVGGGRGRGGADSPAVNTSDESAFPSLGGK